jgi:2-aminoethylphosphonate-pyruvate transaminase
VCDAITAIAVGSIAADGAYATVLLQGSGSYAVESMICSICDKHEKILFLVNGEYGKRMLRIADIAGKTYTALTFDPCEPVNVSELEKTLMADPEIKTVVFVHCETTTGVLNPLEEIVAVSKRWGKKVLVDAMSSFGAYDINMPRLDIDALAASANKCLEGLPGLSFVIAKKELIESSKGNASSHCLDIYDQYLGLYKGEGKFRFTSPTNILLALKEAIRQFKLEGGISTRKQRYIENHNTLVSGLGKLGIKSIVDEKDQSHIITTFDLGDIDFKEMYAFLKQRGFVIYPGKLTEKPTFRLGNIGDVYPKDMQKLVDTIGEYLNG